MASHQLAIAKASFSAGLLRPDPISLSRAAIEEFYALLNLAIVQCTPKNVQKCKQWILQYISLSVARYTALGRYFTALTSSFSESDVATTTTTKREPSIRRKRLHLLYIVNDILYHSKFQSNDASVADNLQPVLPSLVGSAASFKGCPKHHRKIVELLNIWEEKKYYSPEYMEKLREAIANASERGGSIEGGAAPGEGNQLSAKLTKSAPYVLPATHGDPATPWFDLPAGNFMPHIAPNSTRPINPSMIKPLHFMAGAADEKLVFAVKNLLADVQTIFSGGIDLNETCSWDIDDVGQPIMSDEVTGSVRDGEGYYGWSRSFCENTKKRKKDFDIPNPEDTRGRSRMSSPNRRKRSYSPADDDSSQDAHQSARQRRSYSSSHSPDHSTRNERPRSRSMSRSHSRSPQRSSRSPVGSTPHPRAVRPPLSQNTIGKTPISSVPPPPFQQPFNPIFPPPPPPPLHNNPFNGQGSPFGTWPASQMGFWPPPPPPPPPAPSDFNQQSAMHPPPGLDAWQQGPGKGFNNSGWNNGHHRGRGNHRGRGWS